MFKFFMQIFNEYFFLSLKFFLKFLDKHFKNFRFFLIFFMFFIFLSKKTFQSILFLRIFFNLRFYVYQIYLLNMAVILLLILIFYCCFKRDKDERLLKMFNI